MQSLKSLSTALFAIVGITIHCGITAPLTKAAGFDHPSQYEVTRSTFNTSSTRVRCDRETPQNDDSNVTSDPDRQRRGCPLTLDWRYWSLPYPQNDNLCRELDGALVCVTPESANRLRW